MNAIARLRRQLAARRARKKRLAEMRLLASLPPEILSDIRMP